MGYYKNIKLSNFRNFDSLKLNFSKNCNVFYGNNGSGKTNILEAISLFSKGRGLRKDRIKNMIKKETNNLFLNADFNQNSIVYQLTVESYESKNNFLKDFKVNNENSKETFYELNKLNPFLSFLPENERLFLSTPSIRRNFLDRFIYTHFFNYNNLINKYNKNLNERSQLLKVNNYDLEWLNLIERNISEIGLEIYNLRETEVKNLIKYLNICLNEFKIPININAKLIDSYYHNDLNIESFQKILNYNRKIDSLIGGSKIGPHKSDYEFFTDNKSNVSQLSTGQQKTIIILLYLSHCKYLLNNFKIKPILLLDEICSHLDEINREILLTLVQTLNLQIFMTGTSENLFSFLSTNANFYNITHQ